MNSLIIISNEKFYMDEKACYCDNIDMKSTPEELSNIYEVLLIARKLNIKRAFEVDRSRLNVSLNTNVISYLLSILKTLKLKTKYLVFSITPYTFLATLFLSIFRRKVFVYLRSDGFDEYQAKFGFIGKIIYGIMFNISKTLTDTISCSKKILRGNDGKIVSPSQLNQEWFSENNLNSTFVPKLIYVGRLKKEKGVFSLIDIIKNDENISLTIVGAAAEKEILSEAKNIKILNIETDTKKLIKLYDNHSIFILPSFTEGHPMVLLEALARGKPVIVFKELNYLIGLYKGVFVCERNLSSLKKCINHIKLNYESIIELIKSNRLPTNRDFINDLDKAISN